jgi:hypothetical protein
MYQSFLDAIFLFGKTPSSTCLVMYGNPLHKLNQLALENLGSQPIVSKLLPQQKIQPNRKSNAMNGEKLR